MVRFLQVVELDDLKQIIRILPLIQPGNGRFLARQDAVGRNGAGAATVFTEENSS